MTPVLRRIPRRLASVLALCLGAAALGVVTPSIANADISPEPGTPATVTADPLPTVQINGVVWTQVVSGNTVYAGGKFTTARPSGSAPNTNTVTRNNLLAYDIRTGALITSFVPDLNSDVRGLTVSPDGTRLYVVGQFTTANGQSRNRIAAYDTANGALISSFKPSLDARANAVVATNDTVYVGGSFSTVNGMARARLAAVRAVDGAPTTWTASADQRVDALVIADQGKKVIAGGAFSTMNGATALGLAAIDPASGATVPWAAGQTVQSYGTGAAINSLSTDGTNVYGTSYNFYGTGNLEGTFAAKADTGEISWVEDCRGDTYGAFAQGEAVYTVSHAHQCETMVDGFPETNPRTNHHALAFSKAPVNTSVGGSFPGKPAPALLRWYPDLAIGSFTGQNQAGWAVTGNSTYVVMGGEFPNVNGVPQQGLVRFAKTPVAPGKSGPVATATKMAPTVVSLSSGTARVSFPANWDRDNETLTYKVFRDGVTTTPVYTVTAKSTFWIRPTLGFVDKGLAPGSSHRYRVSATDPSGNTVTSFDVSVTVASASTSGGGPYADAVRADGAASYWRLGESEAALAYDSSGFNDLTLTTGTTRGTAGAIANDANAATSFDGATPTTAYSQSTLYSPDTFTVEAWVKTTSTSGGKIVGFGAQQTGNSNSYDRHLYMDNSGRLNFGVYQNGTRVLSTTGAYNDGSWHQVVGSMSSAGMVLYVDGVRVGRNTVTSGNPYNGFWRVGGDSLGGWPNSPASGYLNGAIDDVSVYSTALSATQVGNHYTSSGRSLPADTTPVDTYGKAVYASQPTSFWRLDDSAPSTTAVDSSGSGAPATYVSGVTQGATGALPAGQGKAGLFNGSDGLVVGDQLVSNPGSFSQELWFKTTTDRGGKLVGFGNAATGSSGNYDRHVYMFDDGRLRFGTYTGQINVIDTTASYNDGRWHYMVATQDSTDGMRLYVDGVAVGSNPQTSAQGYDGYWRIGGDNTWGGASSNYFAGTIDEVAIYSLALSASDVATHFKAGGGQAPNQSPTASFTATATGLSAAFDASASVDPDGTLSYAWAFGDGSTGTGVTPSHSYAAAGTYTVELTVTDDRGATAIASRQVTVVKPNQAPAASFTSTSSGLVAKVDGSGSSDPDGSIASYAWDFGDGGTATGAAASHTYGQAGTFQVTLKVTDDKGLSNSVTKSISVVALNAAPTAAFTSSSSGLSAAFDGTGSSDSDGSVASYAWDFGDSTAGTGSKPTHAYAASGTVQVTLTVTDDKGGTGTVTKSVTVTAPAANVAPVASFTSSASGLTATFDGSGSSDSDGSVASYAWDFGDSSAGTGLKPSHAYAAAGTYQVALTVTDDKGATGKTTGSVTITAPAAPSTYASDAFGRTVTGGFGSADTGGAWSLTGKASNFSVDGGLGRIVAPTAGVTSTGFLSGVSSTQTDARVDVVLDKGQTGGGTYVSVLGRRVDAGNDYRLKMRYTADGKVSASVVKVVAGAETTLSSVTLPGLAYAAGDVLRVRLQVTGTGPTTVRGRVWPVAATEPGTWAVSSTDATAALQVAGGFGLSSYLSGSATNAPMTASFDNVVVGAPVGG